MFSQSSSVSYIYAQHGNLPSRKHTSKTPIGIVMKNPRIAAAKYRTVCIHTTTLAFGKQPTAAILYKVIQVTNTVRSTGVHSHVINMILSASPEPF